MIKRRWKIREKMNISIKSSKSLLHVETVVLLSQQKADDHIEVDLELDELDITNAETKAAYRKI